MAHSTTKVNGLKLKIFKDFETVVFTTIDSREKRDVENFSSLNLDLLQRKLLQFEQIIVFD